MCGNRRMYRGGVCDEAAEYHSRAKANEQREYHGRDRIDASPASLRHEYQTDCSQAKSTRRSRRRSRRKGVTLLSATTIARALLASGLSTSLAQTCVPLTASVACPSFNASSISTDSALVGLFPFLSSVTDTASFDTGLQSYIANDFTQTRYEHINFHARLCSDIFQIPNTNRVQQRRSRQHNSVLRKIHHKCSLQCHRTELDRPVRPAR